MQHVRELRKPQKVSGRAPRRLSYAWEQFSYTAPQFTPLFLEHWRELALNQDVILLDPDYQRYLQMELAGLLHVLVVRDAGEMIGYAFMIVNPHLHYASSLWAGIDMFWLKPAYRKGWTGIRIFRHIERRARELKAQVIIGTQKLHFKNGRAHQVGALFEFLGYDPIETVYAKRL
jgi:GNAT superfamily N-acetyltransferase